MSSALVALIALTQVALPEYTPIPCLVCTNPQQAVLTFSGTIKLVAPERIDVFDGKSHQTMSFPVPAGFRGLESSDGKITGAPITRAKPGLLARVTYRTAPGSTIVQRVLLLTINQCRALMAAERLSSTPADCPD